MFIISMLAIIYLLSIYNNKTMDATLNKALEKEKESLEARRNELEQEIARLEAEREAISFRLGHVVVLIRGSEADKVEEGKRVDLREMKAAEESTDPVEIAHRILEEHGTEPVYYRELANTIKERGGELEGADPAMTLVSKLVADERFVRPFRRGWYALRAHYPRVKSVGARKKRKTRHMGRG